jgi:hypothetical protein
MRQRLFQHPGPRLPEPSLARPVPVAAARGQRLSIWRERDSPGFPFVSLERGKPFFRFHFPDDDSAVANAGREQLPVRRDRDGAHFTVLDPERMQFLEVAQVPEPDRLI